MPRQSTIPTLYDDVRRLKLSDITKNGELKRQTIVSGVVTWTNEYTHRKNSISYTLNTYFEDPFVQLDYTCNGEPVSYRIDLTKVQSNLGKGYVYYFVCPRTNKRCRILYQVNKYFLHREAFTDCMYLTQTFSHYNRQLSKVFDKYLKNDLLYAELHSKHFKKYYRGKPTKRYLKIMHELGYNL